MAMTVYNRQRWHCARCNRQFRTEAALEQHKADSKNHNQCMECAFDGLEWCSLMQHCRAKNHDWTCQARDDTTGDSYDSESEESYEYVNELSFCADCGRYFNTHRQFQNHLRSFHPDHHNDGRNYNHNHEHECYGCYETFISTSGMMQHLESGSCASNTDVYDINAYAASCNTWRSYVDGKLRYDMMSKRAVWNRIPFFCPVCDADFQRVSSLLQHAEKSGCTVEVNRGVLKGLLNFIKKKVQE